MHISFNKYQILIIITLYHTVDQQESSDVMGCRRSSSGHIAIIDTWNPKVAKVNVLNEPQVQIIIFWKHHNVSVYCIPGRMISVITAQSTIMED